MSTRGKLIVFEGIDGAGKTTQAGLLLAALTKSGHASGIRFPRYEKSVFGALAGECLAGKHGDFLALSPYLSSLPYILDRAGARHEMLVALTAGHIVCDRYTPSNIAHQCAKLPPAERAAFASFMERGEYEELALPRPDIVFFLRISVASAASLVERKGPRMYLSGQRTKDVHERDLGYQERVAEAYEELVRTKPGWHAVECMDGERLRTPEEVHSLVMEVCRQEKIL
jgi:dTMP kinase